MKIADLHESTNTLQSVIDFAKSIGVDMDAWEDGYEYIRLNWLQRLVDQRGVGAQAMKALCQYADSRRFDIVLDPSGGNAVLEAYYKEFGFRDLPEEDRPDYYPDWQYMMIRRPRRES